MGVTDHIKKVYGHPMFYKTLEAMAELHSRKAHDYAGDEDPLSNFRNVAKVIGSTDWEVSIMFLATKFFRLMNLLERGEEAENEPIEDTLMDLAVYAILTKIMREVGTSAIVDPSLFAKGGKAYEKNGTFLFVTATKDGPVYTWGDGGPALTYHEMAMLVNRPRGGD